MVEASKDVASLLVCTRKKIFCLGDAFFFVSDTISGVLLGHLDPLWRLTLGGSISLKFLLETRLQSFDTLDDLLRFQVQRL